MDDEESGVPMMPNTPLAALSPGALQRLTPEQRARRLKQTKKSKSGSSAAPGLMVPSTVMGAD